MAASSSSPNPSFPNGYDPSSILANTTFVQADPSTFRAIVQRLTGASPTKIAERASSSALGPRIPPFKLHERRDSASKLEMIKLGGGGGGGSGSGATALHSPARHHHRSFFGEGMMMVSPVSTLAVRASPRSPMEAEERAIAEKGFYLHPSPLSTPGGSDPPELLQLFPLHSTRDSNDCSCSSS